MTQAIWSECWCLWCWDGFIHIPHAGPGGDVQTAGHETWNMTCGHRNRDLREFWIPFYPCASPFSCLRSEPRERLAKTGLATCRVHWMTFRRVNICQTWRQSVIYFYSDSLGVLNLYALFPSFPPIPPSLVYSSSARVCPYSPSEIIALAGPVGR